MFRIRPVRALHAMARAACGRELLRRPDLRLPSVSLGNGNGAWAVLADRLHPGSIVYSFGLGEDASFDLALIARRGVEVHAFDPTPRSLDWAARQRFPPGLRVHPWGLAARDGQRAFRPPANPRHVSHTLLERSDAPANAVLLPVKTLRGTLSALGHTRIDLLKMDIEGAEYEVIGDFQPGDVLPDQLLVEFHHRFPGVGVDRTRQALHQLRGLGYRLYAVSPARTEYSFLRVH